MQVSASLRLVLSAGLAAIALTACGGTSSDMGPIVGLTATDTGCEPARSRLASGPVTFAVRNEGSQVTEVYVYDGDHQVVGEVENVGPGTGRDLGVTLGAGTYEVACKPGQTGHGIRTTIRVGE